MRIRHEGLVIIHHIIVPQGLSSGPSLCRPIQPLIMLQLRIDSASNLGLRFIFFHAVVPRVHCACALRRAPAVPARR